MVPVAGEDSIPDAAAFQGKAHVGTAVVHRVNLAVVEEDGYGVSPTGYHGAAPLFNLGQSPCVDVSNRRFIHDFASIPSRAMLPRLRSTSFNCLPSFSPQWESRALSPIQPGVGMQEWSRWDVVLSTRRVLAAIIVLAHDQGSGFPLRRE